MIRGGEVVQIKVKPSDAMLGMLLRASDPKKYGRLLRGGATRKQIEKKLRRKIEAETREKMRRELLASDEEVEEALVKALRAHGMRVRAEQARLAPEGAEAPDGEP